MNWFFCKCVSKILQNKIAFSFYVPQEKRGHHEGEYKTKGLSFWSVTIKWFKELLFCVTFCLDSCSSMFYLLVCLSLQTCCLHSTRLCHMSAFNYKKKPLQYVPLFQPKIGSLIGEMFSFLAGCIWLCCKFALKCMEIKQNQALLSFYLSVNEQWTLLKSCRQCHTSGHCGLWVCSKTEFVYSCLTCQVLCIEFWWLVAKLCIY